MKTIQFNNKKYDIPTSWDEVTIGMQQEVSRVASLQSHVKMLGIIAGYCGIPVQELKSAPVSRTVEMMGSLEFMSEPIPTNKDLKWEFSGHTYTVDKNLGDMQFQDFVSIQTILAENEETYYDALPVVVAVLCKREGETLDDYDPMERAKLMGQMPISVASSIGSFFLLNENYSKLLTHLSSSHAQESILLGKLNELKRTQSQLVVHRGGRWSMRLRIGILKRYTKRLEQQLTKHFSSMQSKS